MRLDPAPVSSIDLDHVGLIVPDLESARALFEQLGFTATPRADHTRTDAQGRVVSAGSSQQSLMFESGYVELMQITDRSAGHPLSAAIDERYGLHILALGVRDAAAWHERCRQQGLPTSPLMDWSRPVATAECQGLARFRFFDTPWQPRDPSYLCWVQHLTPELIRPPALLRHAHGACALLGVCYAGSAAALASWEGRLRQAGACAPDAPPGPRRRLGLAASWIDLLVDPAVEGARPVSMTIAFRSPGEVLERARQAGLEVKPREDGGGSVQLGLGLGLSLHAVQA
jgi:catechol 2,3-dioxygenase-like lactoylglutathione lyase family enzyme